MIFLYFLFAVVSASQPLLPVLKSGIGAGFDATTGTFRELCVTWHYSYNSIYADPITRQDYLVPDELIVTASSNGNSRQTSSVVHNLNQFHQLQNSWFNFKGTINGTQLMANTTSAQEAKTILQSNSTLFLADRVMTYYTGQLWPFSVMMNQDQSDYYKAVMNLPESFNSENADVYRNFISHFGTHLTQFGSFGGEAIYYLGVQNSLFSQYGENWVSNAVDATFTLQNRKLGLSGTHNSTSVNIPPPFTQHSKLTVNLKGGGNETLSGLDWLQSVPFQPGLIRPTLVPHSQIVGDINSNARGALAQAITAYLNGNL